MNHELTQLEDWIAETNYSSKPSLETDSEAVIKDQLTENTGRHMLDSGSAYGRNWEENQKNPVWEKEQYDICDGYVIKNVYHHMTEALDRDTSAVILEGLLYAHGWETMDGDAWLTVMRDFADIVEHSRLRDVAVETTFPDPEEIGIPYIPTDEPAMTGNTYNHEFGSISQDLQFTLLGGPYGEYAIVQVHGGCDIRGGYTSPRVYNHVGQLFTSEGHYDCMNCGMHEAESCAWDAEWLDFHPEENTITCNECEIGEVSYMS